MIARKRTRSKLRCGAALLLGSLLAGCAPAPPLATPQLVNIYATSAAYPWLSGFYDCASSAVVRLTDPQSADISLRLGEPAILTKPAFQIGSEDLLVVAHAGSGITSLSLDQVQLLFSGRVTNWKEVGGSDLPVQVWTFSADTDVEGIFDTAVLNGEPVTSFARLAVSVQAMSDAIETVPGSIGPLPRRQKSAALQEVYAVSALPVLAITKYQPQSSVRDLLACEQAGK